MAKTTDELFAEATEADYETSEPVVLAASDTEEEFQFRIDEHLRTIAIPEKGVVAGVEGDLNVNIARFTMVRYYHGRDLSKLSIRINYRNANGQVNYYNVSDGAVSGDSIVFSWEYAADVTQYKGNVQFVVYLFSATNAVLKQRFFTTLGTLEVLEGLEVDSSIPVSEQTDILLHLKKDLSAYAEEVKKSLPAEYTAMTEQVSSLKEDVNSIKEQMGSGSIGGSGESVLTFLRGLKYVAIGDSIVELQGTKANPKKFGDFNMLKDLQNRDISNVTVNGYVGAIENKYGLVADNQGKSGHTLIQDYANLISINYSHVALVTIAYGCNDARLGNPLGTVNSSDISTYAGALNGLIKKIYENNPECRIIVISAIQRLRVSDFGIADANANGNYLVDFVDMARKVAEKRSCYFIDMYRGCGINQTNLPYYTVEGVHPVNFGYKRMSALVLDEMRKITSITFEPFGIMASGGTETDAPETGGGSGGGSDTPSEDAKPTYIDVSSLLTKDGYVYDGWPNDVLGIGSYKGIEVGQFIYLKPDKTYMIETYRDFGGTDSRIACVSNDASASNGGNYLHGAANDLKGWEVSRVQDGVYKWKRKFSTADSELPKRGTTVCRYLSFGCLNGWTDKAKLSYV